MELTLEDDVLRREFYLKFVNEIYRACDFLKKPVPEGIDDVNDLEEMLILTDTMGCSLVPYVVCSDSFYRKIVKYDKEKETKLKKLLEDLPPFRLRVVPNPCSVVYEYEMETEAGEFIALYYSHEKVFLLSFLNFIDFQMMKSPGDADVNTKIAVGNDAEKYVKVFNA